MMSTILEQLCAQTYTPSDLHRRLGLLQECFEEVFYHIKIEEGSIADAVVAHSETVGSQEDIAFLRALPNDVWKEFAAGNFIDVIASLKKESEILPTLTLYVPVLFDESALAGVALWCKEEVHKGILLELIVKPSTVGGCAFVYNDTYHDVSLSHMMANNKGAVKALLSSYA